MAAIRLESMYLMLKPSLEKIGDGVYAWIGVNGDSNAGAVLTPDGMLAIDAQQTKALGRSFREAIEKEAGRPTTQLIDTHLHLDHTAGNIAFFDIPIVAQNQTLRSMEAFLGPAVANRWLVSDPGDKLRLFFGSNVQELVPQGDPLEQWFLKRLSGPDYSTIELIGPTEIFGDQMVFQRPEGALHADYWGPAHCDGDLILHIPRQKIAFLGDLLFVGRFPWLGDCDLDGWIAHLDRILSLDLDRVVPGHGGLSTLKEVATFRALLGSMRAAVHWAVSSGLSEDATVHEIALPQYAAMPRYREWLPSNLRAAYRYLKQG
jgi:glyoxylase-like metal-dependent hydrolase (beta-lactamase superfamily II)